MFKLISYKFGEDEHWPFSFFIKLHKIVGENVGNYVNNVGRSLIVNVKNFNKCLKYIPII